jgi:exopolysaccharide production protein ExoZ
MEIDRRGASDSEADMKLQSIQALRGLAAMLVLIFHIHELEVLAIADNNLTERAWVGGLFTNGYAGVDLFFVISGFIMVYVTRNSVPGLRQAADFLFGRVTRIYPVWWAFAGCLTIYMFAAHGLSGQNAAWQKASFGQPMVPFLMKSFLLIPQPAFPILNVGWTLVHEVYFYIMFTLFMLAPRKWLPVLLGVWAALVTGGAMMGLSNPVAMGWVSLAVHPMTLEFILGAIAGLAITNGLIWRSGVLTLVASMLLLAGLCYQGQESKSLLLWDPRALVRRSRRIARLCGGRAGPSGSPYLAHPCPVRLARDDRPLSTDRPRRRQRRYSPARRHNPDGHRWRHRHADRYLVRLASGPGCTRTVTANTRLLPARARWAVKLGDWSFALYLCHLIVLSGLRVVFSLLGRSDALAPVFRLGHPGVLDNLAFATSGIVCTLLVSWLSYRMYEEPLTVLFGRLRKSLFRRGQPQPTPV